MRRLALTLAVALDVGAAVPTGAAAAHHREARVAPRLEGEQQNSPTALDLA